MSALWAVALIMLFSGAAKLRSREDVGAVFTRLKVPAPWNDARLARAFPWLELLLALALVQPFTVLRPLVGLAAVALFVAFLVLVVRATGDGVSCGCFGEASAAPITGQTVVRNVLFLLLAVMALFEGVASLAVHGIATEWLPLTAFGEDVTAWTVVVTLLLAAAAVLVGRESVPAAASAVPVPAAGVPGSAAPAPAEGQGDEPERRPFPVAAVQQGGAFVTLHQLVIPGAVVALRLSVGCGSCSAVIARLPELVECLGPIRVRVLMPQTVPGGELRHGTIPAELVLEDPAGAAAGGLGLTGFPSAVLLGADGMTAGGPVFGADEVIAFLEEIGEIVATELPAAAEGSHRP